jgi:PKD repeat protein
VFVALIFALPVLLSLGGLSRGISWFFASVKSSFSVFRNMAFTSFLQGFKSSAVRNLIGGVAGLAIALVIVGTVLFVVYSLTKDPTVKVVARILLNVATVIVVGTFFVNFVYTLTVFARLGATVQVLNSMSKAFQMFGTPTLIIGIVLAVVFFVVAYLMGSIGEPGSVEFDIALAFTIAQVLVLIIFFVIFVLVLGWVGAIISFLILIIDAILGIFGITGIQGWLANAIAGAIYDVDYLIHNMEDDNRLDISFKDVTLSNLDDGFTSENSLFLTMRVTNTLDAGTRPNDAEAETKFNYSITADEFDYDSFEVTDWDLSVIPGSSVEICLPSCFTISSWYIQHATTVSNETPIPLNFAGTGINRNFSDHIFLNEGYRIPYEGCWQFIVDIDCTFYHTTGTSHIPLGEYQVYDILPPTVAEFADLSWNLGHPAFPPQKDFDNDGIFDIDEGGTDTNDEAYDQDGDGLSDTFELSYGLDVNNPDTDGDGLLDSEELTHNTNPLRADSDGDGLDDYTEVVAGWLIVYNEDNDTTRVWSDPNLPDADNDTLTDLEEFVFGLNPWVATDPSVLDTIIDFGYNNVSEANAPHFLFEFEEPAGSEFFVDNLGMGYLATCNAALSQCPALVQNGVFDQAVSFDGINDIVEVENINIGNTSFTMAGWVKSGNPSFAVSSPIFHSNFNLLVYPGLKFACGVDGTATDKSPNFPQNVWTHWACVYDREAETMSLYVDGQHEGTISALDVDSETGSLWFGNIALFPNGVDLDEVSLFKSALSANDILDLYETNRYIINDLIVAPGAPLVYAATVSNTHPTQDADGLLTAQTMYFDPAIGVPDVVLGFEALEKESTFIDTVGQSSTATCVSDLTCPSTGNDGNRYAAIEFDGVDDYILMPPVGDVFDEYTLAFWIKLDATPSQDMYILDTTSEAVGAIDIYINTNGEVVYDVAGSTGPEVTNFKFTAGDGTLGQWYFLAFLGVSPTDVDFYVNPKNNDTPDTNLSPSVAIGTLDQIIIGPGVIGNSIHFDAPLDAQFDDFVFYNQQLGSPSATNNKELSEQVYAGFYWFDYIGYSSKTPTFILEFNDVGVDFVDAEFFIDHQRESDHGICESTATCPKVLVDGVDGRMGEFDGVNDRFAIDNFDTARTYITFTELITPSFTSLGSGINATTTITVLEAISITFYINPDSYPDPGESAYLVDSKNGGNWIDLWLDSDGKIHVTRNGSIDLLTGVIPLNGWTQVEIEIVLESTAPLSWQYIARIWVDGGLADSQTYCSGTFVHCSDKTSSIGGSIADPAFVGGPSAATVIANPDAVYFNGQLDQLDIQVGNYTFDVDSREVGYENAMNGGITAHCSDIWSCPPIDAGVFGSGARFDGTEDYLTHDRVSFVQNDYTIAAWFKTSDSAIAQTILAAYDPKTSEAGVVLEVLGGGVVRFIDRFPVAAFGGSSITSSSGYNNGQWHHVVAIKEGDTLTLIIDGVDTATGPSSNGYGEKAYVVEIGRDGSGDYFNGSLDEIVIIPSAIANGSYNAADILMAAPYPAIAIDAEFNVFDIPALSAAVATGSARVEPDAVNSLHFFDQQVDAALQLQTTINYPILDGQVAFLTGLVPFEAPPNTTVFANVVQTPAFYTCVADHCPVTGLRGKVGRAAFFDGFNDYIDVQSVPDNALTFAAWVKGDRGTIFMTDDDIGVELDFNRFRVWLIGGPDGDLIESVLYFDLPENQWTHVVAVYDAVLGFMYIYINGAIAGINGAPSVGVGQTVDRIGANIDGSDPFHGYIDDFRTYNFAFFPSQVSSLYDSSTAQLHFEFDEDENAAVFLDQSVNNLVAEPLPQVCYPLSLVSMTVNSLVGDPSTVNFDLSSDRLARSVDVSPGSRNLNAGTQLCSPKTLEVSVAFSGTSTSLGTTLIMTDPTTTTVNFTSGGNNIDLTYAVDSQPTYRLNPIPGTDGKIGNTAYFDGEGYLTVKGASEVGNRTNEFTIMGWIRPNALPAQSQAILSTGDIFSKTGFTFGINGQRLEFRPRPQPVQQSGQHLEAGIWQHVALVFDGGNDIHFYLDGVLKSTIPGNGNLIAAGSVARIGANMNNGVATDLFQGQIDELSFRSQALSGSEIFAFYLLELRWYRDVNRSVIQVDAVDPLVSLLSGPYHDNKPIDLVVSAVDVDSYVQFVDFGLKAPGDSEYSWSELEPCQRSGGAPVLAVFCVEIDPTALGGEGKYDLKFLATDAAGNQTEISETIWVDDTPPIVDIDYTGQWVRTKPGDSQLEWTVEISGTVSDPDIDGDPGSGVLLDTGVSTRTLSVTIHDRFGQPAGDGIQMTHVNPDLTWSIDYRFAGKRPTGLYTVHVWATDNGGNSSTAATGSLLLDAQPPSVEINLWNLGANISSATTLSGTVYDSVDPGGAIAQFHFEEPTGSMFYDYSYENNHGQCSDCPTLATIGAFGSAVRFNQASEYISVSHSINPISTTFSASAWISVTNFSDSQVILSQQDGTGTGRSWLYLDTAGRLASDLGGNLVTSTVQLATGQWHHIGLSYDGSVLNLFVDGDLNITRTVSVEFSDGDHIIGIANDLVSTPFDGQVDELILTNHDLNPVLFYTLAQKDVIGVDQVDLWMEVFPFTDTVGIPDWTPVSLQGASGDELVGWQYIVPAGLEDYFRIHIRATDVFSNTGGPGRVWLGIVDLIAPRLTFQTTTAGYGSAASTEFNFSIDDKFLDELTIVHPCLGSLAPLDETIHSVTDMTEAISGGCRVNGFEPGSEEKVEACDIFGRCTTITETLAGGTPTTSVLIRVPEQNATFDFSGAAVPIEIGAFAAVGNIAAISIRDQNGPIDSVSAGVGITDTIWNTAAWLPVSAGTYTLTARMTDTFSTVVTDTVTIFLFQNTAPVADDDTFTRAEDSIDNLLNVLNGDTDIDNDDLSIVSAGIPDQGGIIITGTDILTYTPAADFFGTEVFSYTITDANGGFDSATVTVTVTNVQDDPVADDDSFIVNQDSVNNPLDVLDGDSDIDGENVTVLDLGTPDQGGSVINGGTIVTYTPQALFSGTEVFSYTISDGSGGFDSAAVTVTVINPEPIADFSFMKLGLDVDFMDLSTDVDGFVVGWEWDFGDGLTSILQSPSHSYAISGTYPVTLIVTDNEGLTGTQTHLVPVAPLNLVVTPPGLAFGEQPIFTSSDPLSLTLQNLGYEPISVTQIALSGDFPSSFFVQPILLPITIPGGASQVISVTYTPTSTAVLYPVPIHRVNVGGPDLAASPLDWAEDSLLNPSPYLISGPTQNGPMSTPFSFDPSVPAGTDLTVFESSRWDHNLGGPGLQWLFPVTVGEPLDVRLYFQQSQNCTVGYQVFDIVIDGEIVVPSYDINADVGCHVGVMKSFTITPTDTALDIHLVQVSGQLPHLNGIEVLETALGEHTSLLTLSHTGDNPAVGVAVSGIPAENNNPITPTAQFSYTTSLLEATFSDLSTDNGTILDWVWDFGDGVTDTLQNPVHTYAVSGTYTVSLTVEDDEALSGSVQMVISVADLPLTVYTTYLAIVSDGDLSTEDGTTPEMDVGVGVMGTLQNPVHSYARSGTYSVSRIVADSTSFAREHWGRSNPDQYFLIELYAHLIHEFSLPDGAWLVDWR